MSLTQEVKWDATGVHCIRYAIRQLYISIMTTAHDASVRLRYDLHYDLRYDLNYDLRYDLIYVIKLMQLCVYTLCFKAVFTLISFHAQFVRYHFQMAHVSISARVPDAALRQLVKPRV